MMLIQKRTQWKAAEDAPKPDVAKEATAPEHLRDVAKPRGR